MQETEFMVRVLWWLVLLQQCEVAGTGLGKLQNGESGSTTALYMSTLSHIMTRRINYQLAFDISWRHTQTEYLVMLLFDWTATHGDTRNARESFLCWSSRMLWGNFDITTSTQWTKQGMKSWHYHITCLHYQTSEAFIMRQVNAVVLP